jgi:hypothetical protein
MLHGFKMLRGATYESGVRALSTGAHSASSMHYTYHVWSPLLRTSYAWRKPYLRREWPETEAAPTKGV